MTKPTFRLSRRTFLRLAAFAGLGVAAAAYERVARRIGYVNYLRWLVRGQTQGRSG